jgi:hypothetical protein
LNFAQDLKYAVRSLSRSRVFTAIAVISLALGIGANTAIFQLLDAVRLRTLPVKSPQELVELRIGDMTHARGNWLRQNALTNPLWEQIRQRQQVFSQVFAWADEEFNISPDRETRTASGLWVSGNFFDAVGVPAMLGRVFHEEDDRRGCGLRGAVISYAFWQREFGGRASIIGEKINLAAGPVEVIGVGWPLADGIAGSLPSAILCLSDRRVRLSIKPPLTALTGIAEVFGGVVRASSNAR